LPLWYLQALLHTEGFKQLIEPTFFRLMEKEKREQEKKEKKNEEIQEMSHKKKRFEKDITSLESFAVDFADKAESNALRR
jgi:hypothetical protein